VCDVNLSRKGALDLRIDLPLNGFGTGVLKDLTLPLMEVAIPIQQA